MNTEARLENFRPIVVSELVSDPNNLNNVPNPTQFNTLSGLKKTLPII